LADPICRVDFYTLDFMTRYDMPGDAPYCGILRQERDLSDSDQDFVYLPRQKSLTERISRHCRAKRGKSGQLDEKPTTVLLPLGKVN